VASRSGEVIGGLFFGHEEPGRFREKHERMVVGLAAQAAVALDNARLYSKLEQSEKDLSDFFENGAVGCHWVGPDGTILRANETELRMMGYAREEYVGRNIADFHVDRSVIDDILRRLRSNEILHDVPARVRTKSGQVLDVLIDSSALMRDGRFVHTRCFTRDVTEYRKAAAARALLAAVVESSDDAIVTKRLDSVITSWNRGAERLFGYRQDEVVGKPITIIIPDELRSEEDTIIAKLKRGERVEHFETRRRAKDGTILDVSLTISPIKDENGRIVGASKVARDVTERRLAEDKIRKLNSELEHRVRERTSSLEEALAELEAFSYTVAHDLRAPLRSIHTFGQMLLEDHSAQLDEPGKKYLSQMIEGGARMDALTSDLLTYSRVSRQEAALAPLNLESVVERVLEELKTELHERKARVEIEHPLGDILANDLLVGQAMTNLISNAAKFVAPGVEPRIRIRSEMKGNSVRLWVEDNGIGIEPEYQGKLFKVFERIHSRETYPGTGIGLAIVRRALERMGGRWGVESAPGEGSKFWIEMRAQEDS
jgi:PAS domain S-box-containing protein